LRHQQSQQDNIFCQVEANDLQASNYGLKILSQALKVALTAVKPLRIQAAVI
jgi:hypothetical protein